MLQQSGWLAYLPLRLSDRDNFPPQLGGAVAVSDVISFGPYRLIPAQRILLKQEEVVDVGNRAFDILVALAEAAGCRFPLRFDPGFPSRTDPA
jgi:DNA-binding response OmpR family regulator